MFAALVLLRLGTELVTAGCSSLASVGVVLGAALALSVMITLSTGGGGWEFTVREWWIVALLSTAGGRMYHARTSSRLGRFAPIGGGVAVVLFSSFTREARVPEPRTLAAPFASASYTPTMTVGRLVWASVSQPPQIGSRRHRPHMHRRPHQP